MADFSFWSPRPVNFASIPRIANSPGMRWLPPHLYMFIIISCQLPASFIMHGMRTVVHSGHKYRRIGGHIIPFIGPLATPCRRQLLPADGRGLPGFGRQLYLWLWLLQYRWYFLMGSWVYRRNYFTGILLVRIRKICDDTVLTFGLIVLHEVLQRGEKNQIAENRPDNNGGHLDRIQRILILNVNSWWRSIIKHLLGIRSQRRHIAISLICLACLVILG